MSSDVASVIVEKITKQGTFVCHLATSESAKCNSIGGKEEKCITQKSIIQRGEFLRALWVNKNQSENFFYYKILK